MEIKAKPYYRNTGNVHTIRKEIELKDSSIKGTDDGGAVILVKTGRVALSGEFELEVRLTDSDIKAIAKKAVTGALAQRVADLEKKLASLAA